MGISCTDRRYSDPQTACLSDCCLSLYFLFLCPYGQANVLLHTVSVFKSHISDAKLICWLCLVPAVAFNISLLVINSQLKALCIKSHTPVLFIPGVSKLLNVKDPPSGMCSGPADTHLMATACTVLTTVCRAVCSVKLI